MYQVILINALQYIYGISSSLLWHIYKYIGKVYTFQLIHV